MSRKILTAVAILAGMTWGGFAQAQYQVITSTPNFNGGYTHISPNGGISFSNRNFNGGYTHISPNGGVGFSNPNFNGGYTHISPNGGISFSNPNFNGGYKYSGR